MEPEIAPVISKYRVLKKNIVDFDEKGKLASHLLETHQMSTLVGLCMCLKANYFYPEDGDQSCPRNLVFYLLLICCYFH